MSTLSSLKLVAVKKPRTMPATVIRRNKLAAKLWEQINLAQSQLDGKPFVVLKYRSIKDSETGLSKQVEVPKKDQAVVVSKRSGQSLRIHQIWNTNHGARQRQTQCGSQ
jgi:hypothetical protein